MGPPPSPHRLDMISWIPKGFHFKAPGGDPHINFLIKLFAKVTQSAKWGQIPHQHIISFHLNYQPHLYIKCPDFMKGTPLLLNKLLQLVLFYYIKSVTWHTDLCLLYDPFSELGTKFGSHNKFYLIFWTNFWLVTWTTGEEMVIF